MSEVFPKPAAAGIVEKIINGETYILVQERFKEDAPLERGLIEIPAGKIREFENIYDCLRREIKEETGLDVIEIKGENEAQIFESNGYKVLNYTPFTSSQCVDGYYPIMVQIFICSIKGQLLKESNESQNIRWISINELERLLNKSEDKFFPMHVLALKKYLKIIYQVHDERHVEALTR